MREGAGFHEWGAGIRARFNNEKARYLAEANVSNEDGLKEVRRRALANAARWGQQFI